MPARSRPRPRASTRAGPSRRRTSRPQRTRSASPSSGRGGSPGGSPGRRRLPAARPARAAVSVARAPAPPPTRRLPRRRPARLDAGAVVGGAGRLAGGRARRRRVLVPVVGRAGGLVLGRAGGASCEGARHRLARGVRWRFRRHRGRGRGSAARRIRLARRRLARARAPARRRGAVGRGRGAARRRDTAARQRPSARPCDGSGHGRTRPTYAGRGAHPCCSPISTRKCRSSCRWRPSACGSAPVGTRWRGRASRPARPCCSRRFWPRRSRLPIATGPRRRGDPGAASRPGERGPLR